MDANELATKKHIEQATALIMEYVQSLVAELRTKQTRTALPKYLRSKDVKKLLSIQSDNTIKDMRLKGELPYTTIGDTYLYPADQILAILKENQRNTNPKV